MCMCGISVILRDIVDLFVNIVDCCSMRMGCGCEWYRSVTLLLSQETHWNAKVYDVTRSSSCILRTVRNQLKNNSFFFTGRLHCTKNNLLSKLVLLLRIPVGFAATPENDISIATLRGQICKSQNLHINRSKFDRIDQMRWTLNITVRISDIRVAVMQL